MSICFLDRPTLFVPSLGQIPTGPASQSKNAPGIFVIYMDVMYAGFAGAKTGHMGVSMFELSHCKSYKHKKSPSSNEDELVLYLKPESVNFFTVIHRLVVI